MVNSHFLKRLFFFVAIIAGGAVVTLAATYLQNRADMMAETSALDS